MVTIAEGFIYPKLLPMHALDDLGPRAVRCVFSSAPSTTVECLLAWGKTQHENERVALCDVDLSRPVYSMLGGLVDSLARAALAVWPDWYADPDLFLPDQEESLQATRDRMASRYAARHNPAVLRLWLGHATALCRVGRLPVVADFSPTVQLHQLSLAIATNLTLVVQVCPNRVPESSGLLGLARNLEWLARHASARVVAVLPADWSRRSELDSVSWGSWTIDESGPLPTTEFDEPLAMVSPIWGRPHPYSPGEQLMAARLVRDPVLGPLFKFNQPVITVRGSRYQVDLVWFAGKLVVEIDGYRCHSSPVDFANDRQRDYELQLSGYIVLRLTHASVMADVELAIDKIRDMVNLRTEHPPSLRPNA